MAKARGKSAKSIITVRCAIPVRQDRTAARYGPGTTIARDYGREYTDQRPHEEALKNFEEIWVGKPRAQSRYSDGSFSVLYTAATEAVARTERSHWLHELAFKDSLTDQVRNLFFYRCRISGSFSDHFTDWPTKSWLVHPTDYSQCNLLARNERAAGLDYMLVPSARRLNGFCVPVFKRIAAEIKDSKGSFAVHWDRKMKRMYWRTGTARHYIRVDDVYGSL